MPLGRLLLDARVLSLSGYSIRVARLVVSVSARSGGPRIECDGRSRAFLADGVPADLSLAVDAEEIAPRPPGPLVFDSGGVWRAYRGDRSRLVLRFHDPRLPFPYKEASLDDAGGGEIRLDPRAFDAHAAVDPLEHPLDELLFQRLLGERGLDAGGGVELHAVGVVAPSGVGYLFAGQSGDGKTTTARLWQEAIGATVLSDDRIVLTRDAPGRWRMHGTPWHGEAELAEPDSVPLAGVFLLARGTRSELQPLGPAHAAAALLARSFPPFHDEHATARLVERLGALVAEVPCHRFPFLPDASAVRCILSIAG